jgi:hypothetical protein
MSSLYNEILEALTPLVEVFDQLVHTHATFSGMVR